MKRIGNWRFAEFPGIPGHAAFKGLSAWVDNLNPITQVKNVINDTKQGKWYDAIAATTGVGTGEAPSVLAGYTKAMINPAYEYGYTSPGQAAANAAIATDQATAKAKADAAAAKQNALNDGGNLVAQGQAPSPATSPLGPTRSLLSTG